MSKPADTEWDRLLADMTAARVAQEEAARREQQLWQKEEAAALRLERDLRAVSGLPTQRGRLVVTTNSRDVRSGAPTRLTVHDRWWGPDSEITMEELLLFIEIRAVALTADPLYIIDDSVIPADTVREAVAAVVRHHAVRLTKEPDEVPF